MSSLDYLDLCRLCLVKDRVSVPIFEGEGDVRQIFLKITACLPVKVDREDKLPKKICDDCVYKVELFYQFWNTTVNAEKQLLQWLGEVGLEDKPDYVTNVLNQNVMKSDQSGGNRLDGSMMQQVSGHQNNMGMGMMDNIGLGMPMMMPATNQQQMTSVPMDTSGSSVQNVQEIPGTSNQSTHEQITQSQTNTNNQQEEEEDSSEEEENSEDECDGEEGLPVKEESEEDPNNGRAIEPTTFVNVSLACDEAGPSGLQQQKIAEMPEMAMPQNTDGDPKSGASDPLSVDVKPEPLPSPKLEDTPDEARESRFSREIDPKDNARRKTSGVFGKNLEAENARTSKRRVEKSVECDHCRRRFLKKSNLAEHLKQHRHKCADCSKTFSLRRYLISHVERIHRRQVYECSVCEYKSNNKGTLKNHYIRLHTSSYDYSCDTCGKQFKIKKALNHHVKQNHSGAPPIVCDVCGHFSKNLHALKAHMKYRHYKPEFVCRICRRGMTTRENLEQHLAWHETREKVLCPTCGKRFRGRDLDSHMRVHTGVKPFPCPVCGKSFRRQTAQEQHVLIHTGKRPYVCDICGQAFAQKPGLICHRKRHPGPLPPLPVVSVKSIVTEFTREYATRNTIKIE